MNKNFRKMLDGGAELEATMGSFEECERLYEAVMGELGGIDFEKESTLGLFAKLSASKSVKNALWPLLNRATYNGQRITRDTFEPEKERADFFPVAQEVLVYNLRPFFLNLGSQFAGMFPKSTGSPA